VTQLDARLPQPFTFPRAYFIQFFPRSRGLLRRDRDDWRIQAFADEQRCFESTSSLKSRVTHRQTAAPISRMMMRDAAVIKDLAAGSVTVSVAFSFRDPEAKCTKDCVTASRSIEVQERTLSGFKRNLSSDFTRYILLTSNLA